MSVEAKSELPIDESLSRSESPQQALRDQPLTVKHEYPLSRETTLNMEIDIEISALERVFRLFTGDAYGKVCRSGGDSTSRCVPIQPSFFFQA